MAVTLLCAFAGLSTGSVEFVTIVWLLGSFVLRAFYFTLFEMGAKAATPGKRLLGIRVAARNGGRLTADAIFIRNVTREIEVFMPLGFLFSQGADNIDGIIILVGFCWSAIFAFFPLFNRDRLRPGDIIAGTWVVKAPKRALKEDIAGEGEKALSEFKFTPAEIDVYGVHELQVLEDVLRSRDPDAMKLVAEKIRTKIGRPPESNAADGRFLDAYYTALRKRLETKLLYGVRRKDKHDRR